MSDSCCPSPETPPGRLWSLWDIVRPYDAASLLDLIAFMEGMRVYQEMEDKEDKGIIDKSTREGAIEEFSQLASMCSALGLAGAAASAEKLVAFYGQQKPTYKGQADLFAELKGRLVDEKRKRIFFVLTLKETEFYSKPLLGWEPIVSRFPSILNDLEEASKCLALSRYAAAVFHSTQIVEAGLIELGTFLKVTDPLSGWTAVSKALTSVIAKNHNQRTPFEKRNFPFLEQVQGTVASLKNSWRNKISHAQGRLVLMTTDFSPEIAEEILMATRSFMRRLTDDLPPPKPKKPSSASSKGRSS
jgi:hypothetical protein